MIRVLLNRFVKGSIATNLKGFAEGEISQISKTNIVSSDFLPAFAHPAQRLQKIHYSWFLPILKSYPKEVQASVVSALPEYHCTQLCQALHCQPLAKPLVPLFKSYLLTAITKLIKGFDKVLPIEYLHQSEMHPLLSWTKQQLVELIEFMGINDLGEEIRHIVDKKILKNVYGCLTPKELQYLKMCMHYKEQVSSPSLGLDKWNGNREKFKAVLQSRGLIRLGKALSGQDSDFIWHLIHQLDTGRAQTLLKYYSSAPIPGITTVLAQQVLNLMNVLKKQSDT
jgi:hypothetical protein